MKYARVVILCVFAYALIVVFVWQRDQPQVPMPSGTGAVPAQAAVAPGALSTSSSPPFEPSEDYKRADEMSRQRMLEQYRGQLSYEKRPERRQQILDYAASFGWTEADLIDPNNLDVPGAPMTPEEEMKALDAVRIMAKGSAIDSAGFDRKAFSKDPAKFVNSFRDYIDRKSYLAHHSSSETVSAAIRQVIRTTSSPEVAKDMCQILGLTALDSNRQFLVEELGREKDVWRRQWLAAALSNIENRAQETGQANVKPLIDRFVTATDPGVRTVSLQALASGRLPALPEVEAVLWDVVAKSSDPDLRAIAVAGLGMANLDDTKLVQLVRLADQEPDPRVRDVGLAALQNHSHRDPVRSYLWTVAEGDLSSDRRQYAIRLLAIAIERADEKEVVRMQTLSAKEADPAVRGLLDEALKRRSEASPGSGPQPPNR